MKGYPQDPDPHGEHFVATLCDCCKLWYCNDDIITIYNPSNKGHAINLCSDCSDKASEETGIKFFEGNYDERDGIKLQRFIEEQGSVKADKRTVQLWFHVDQELYNALSEIIKTGSPGQLWCHPDFIDDWYCENFKRRSERVWGYIGRVLPYCRAQESTEICFKLKESNEEKNKTAVPVQETGA